MNWLQLISNKRFGMEAYHEKSQDDRSTFQRDFDRLIFSTPFRRLQNKTQVFPLPGSVFVHNRLTHSLEVSCVGRSLGRDVAKILVEKYPEFKESNIQEIGTIVSAACLAHDMGNPPFGHSGEKAISTYFSEGKGLQLKEKLTSEEWNDLIHFEGNANAFRLLTHQFKGRREGGFALTYATLASIVKYPYASACIEKKSKFGFFLPEQDSFEKIANDLGMHQVSKKPLRYTRHPLVFLVEAADDICYQIMDIEDAHKLKILTTRQTKKLLLNFLTEKRQKKAKLVFEHVKDANEQIAYLRSTVIGILVNECVKTFMLHEEEILAGTFHRPLIEEISELPKKAYEHCSSIAFQQIYRSKEVLDIELAGYQIIYTLIDLMIDAVLEPQKAYSKLLIERVSSQYEINAPTLYGKVLAVLDYVSGMTDVYALDLYRKINGNSLPAI
jgi:dGTPase